MAPNARNVKIATSTGSGGPLSAHPTGNSARTTALIGTSSLLVGVLLAAANLRPAVTSLASVLDELLASVGATHTLASLLTTVPVLCFGLAGVCAPVLSRRYGLARAVGVALALLTGGLILRVLAGPVVILGGTLIACAGIAVGNVLIPVVVKQSFPNKLGLVTGLYAAVLAAGGGLGAAVTAPLSDALGGWRLALGSWALLAAAALVAWSVGARHSAATTSAPPMRHRSLLRDRLAWTVTMFFALQALVAYVVMGWLPEVFVSAGVDRATAGVYLAITSLFGVPVGLLLPPLVARLRDQSLVIAVMTALGGAGFLGVLLAPAAAPPAWTLLIGFGMGVFPLAIMVIALRADTPEDTAALSAMAQGIGYLISALGPLLFGLLRGATGGWTASLVFVLVVITAQVFFGYAAGRARTVRPAEG
ncbi:MFS transporter [Actinokineospora enzanensis]|uniref:MFS transporter n=1 Tax=Actinokineospora enzanensis TaxID=155975 RepID=UPI000377FB3F|nr:MFS transporter [Actinokineospora enzanensis]